jgi:hypothetical protein
MDEINPDDALEALIGIRKCGKHGCIEDSLLCLIVHTEEGPECIHSCAMHIPSLIEDLQAFHNYLLRAALDMEEEDDEPQGPTT